MAETGTTTEAVGFKLTIAHAQACLNAAARALDDTLKGDDEEKRVSLRLSQLLTQTSAEVLRIVVGQPITAG